MCQNNNSGYLWVVGFIMIIISFFILRLIQSFYTEYICKLSIINIEVTDIIAHFLYPDA